MQKIAEKQVIRNMERGILEHDVEPQVSEEEESLGGEVTYRLVEDYELSFLFESSPQLFLPFGLASLE